VVLGSDNQLVLALMGDLSRALEESNKFEEDISIAERRAIPCSQNLGMSHFDILIALNALGIIL
jgi:hypothetical protein